MAVTFTLTSTGLTTVDLTDTTDNIALQEQDYVPIVATPTGDGSIPPYVVETMPVTINASSYDGYATILQNLHALQKRAAEYWVDQQQVYPVWLTCKLDGETGTRCALVKRIDFAFAPWIDSIYQECGTSSPPPVIKGTLLVERHPYWERDYYRVMPTSAAATGLSRAYDYTVAGAELQTNGGFETAGGGGADIWGTWVESAGDGALADEGVIVHGGAHAAKMTSGPTSNTVIVGGTGDAQEYQIYYLSFYARGDGTNAGRYRVYDATNGADIIATITTGITAAAYAQVGATFTAPAGCAAINLYLYCPPTNGGICYFDDVSIRLQGHDVVGDVGARIDRLNFTAAAGDVLGRMWIGLRSANRHGTLANFERYWEAEDGFLSTDAALAADATANPGGGGNTKVTITPGTASLAHRMSWRLNDITANESDNFGNFLWLLRTQVSAGEWQVHLRYGHTGMADADYVQGQVVTVDNTSWDLYEMDVQPIPFRNMQVLTLDDLADSYEQYFTIQVWAERTSGAGTLDLDVLCPVPVDEGWARIGTFQDAANTVYLGSSPYDAYIAYEYTAAQASWREFGECDAPNFYLPPGDGRMIIVIARETTSDITDQISIGAVTNWGRYYERWISLRGAE